MHTIQFQAAQPANDSGFSIQQLLPLPTPTRALFRREGGGRRDRTVDEVDCIAAALVTHPDRSTFVSFLSFDPEGMSVPENIHGFLGYVREGNLKDREIIEDVLSLNIDAERRIAAASKKAARAMKKAG